MYYLKWKKFEVLFMGRVWRRGWPLVRAARNLRATRLLALSADPRRINGLDDCQKYMNDEQAPE